MRLTRNVSAYMLILLLVAGCSNFRVFEPPGERVFSCSGTMSFRPGDRSNATLYVYRTGDGDMTPYISIPSRGMRYAVLQDIDIEGETVSLTMGDGDTVRGRIDPESIEISGGIRFGDASISFDLDRD